MLLDSIFFFKKKEHSVPKLAKVPLPENCNLTLLLRWSCQVAKFSSLHHCMVVLKNSTWRCMTMDEFFLVTLDGVAEENVFKHFDNIKQMKKFLQRNV